MINQHFSIKIENQKRNKTRKTTTQTPVRDRFLLFFSVFKLKQKRVGSSSMFGLWKITISQ